MNKSFVKELVLTNYLFIGAFGMIIIISNLLYGGTLESWSKSIGLLLVLALALAVKIKRIKSSTQKLDERLQMITYRAVSIGFYLMLGAILWFYTKEIIFDGKVSMRTIVELLAGLVGYLGGFQILNRHY
ncbi:hypothetical protein [Geosporobacter ferrireducens]|uniref:Uncharacterized protein n=1 Tax=Geosporobacter ferrireducens TaxID=1424294 RepID=A0A1D8GFE5_9FIRM|nr:hypothetical protein [Geosporobacter ferrireducens]AOT69620.1 hypothetical protein Gferi_08540 [Geosporobacter ferrireducens]MTI54678.1 hypothetical protein [Geosporobacter ferrireducens]